jgi:Cysteine-rich secretory protein family
MTRRFALLACLIPFVALPACAAEPEYQARTIRPTAPPVDSRPSDGVERRLLDAHNVERRAVGAPDLIWDDRLESEARTWGRTLLRTNAFRHDPSQHGHGENLWTGWSGRSGRIFTPEEMVGEWAAEQRDYSHEVFPRVSRTGDWTAVGHYTQMVWRGTTHVGCAIDRRGDRSVLTCRYSPPGNIDGYRAY